MNENICKRLIEQPERFVPHLFTRKQIQLLAMYLDKKELTNSEKTYFYSTIKKKIEALTALNEEFYITGEEMLPERVEQAKKILKEINQERAFISGSFLYKKDYNDIDIFVISRRRKSYYQKKKHFTFITEKDLCRPIFTSAAKYSVASFPAVVEANLKRRGFDDILFIYQWVINQILEGEDQKEIRDLVFQQFIYTKKEVLDARSLDLKVQEIKNLNKGERISRINQITKEILVAIYSANYLYKVLSDFIKRTKEMGKEYKTDNIPIFLNFAKGVQHECRRAQA